MILPDRVLFVGAHCDDIELFAGGLLARACHERRRVGVLVFSDHRGVIPDSAARQARQEFCDNLAWLRTESGNEIEDHSSRMLPACRGAFEEERGFLYEAMESLRSQYDLVVTHSRVDTNQDHQQVAAEARRVFKAHASLLGGEFPNNDPGEFRPQFYVALSPREVAAKVRMVASYRSQDFGGRPYLDAGVVEALLRVRGGQIRELAAEAFSIEGRGICRMETEEIDG